MRTTVLALALSVTLPTAARADPGEARFRRQVRARAESEGARILSWWSAHGRRYAATLCRPGGGRRGLIGDAEGRLFILTPESEGPYIYPENNLDHASFDECAETPAQPRFERRREPGIVVAGEGLHKAQLSYELGFRAGRLVVLSEEGEQHGGWCGTNEDDAMVVSTTEHIDWERLVLENEHTDVEACRDVHVSGRIVPVGPRPPHPPGTATVSRRALSLGLSAGRVGDRLLFELRIIDPSPDPRDRLELDWDESEGCVARLSFAGGKARLDESSSLPQSCAQPVVAGSRGYLRIGIPGQLPAPVRFTPVTLRYQKPGRPELVLPHELLRPLAGRFPVAGRLLAPSETLFSPQDP
jgi:hypothetical protein